MNKRRLTDLVNVLRKVRPSSFRMDEWWCGTKGCAVGHYCHAFPRRELKLRPGPDEFLDFTPVLGNECSLKAVAAHFGIESNDAYDLFMPGYYAIRVTPKQVAARVEKYIKTGLSS